ncbi:DNA repair protein RecN [Thiomicrorhabdus heinhorstiae]|uniref:DNA repair protein RecN n=1 Tax=Thiomicrorhabdus heinhorstiae TaxID=2748010 RepID=A0ABS0BVN5_9GAMM|nr:DNA repair protein RecN [Thiomicrorhabdus heinhorstiae]MBF6057888.1 DNA repair protein RecN [Thiomicrorhabdus heinhorstiae]
MLVELSIQNLALIEQLRLNFAKGFSSLTGETGAGKSILLDALGLALGDRADSSLVRHDCNRADVTALFDIGDLPEVQNWLAEQELDSELHCLLRRTVNQEGRSKAYINGVAVPLTLLKTLAPMLIDIHGQHEHQSLTSSSKQLELLDAYSNQPQQLESAQTHYKQWQHKQKALQGERQKQQELQARLELLSFQQQEFEQLAPQTDEYQTLSEQQKELSHANEIKLACHNAYQAIEGEDGASHQLNLAIHNLESIIAFAPALQSVLQPLQSALIDAQDAAGELLSYAENIELDPAQLEEVEDRLGELYAMAKKYHLEPENLLGKQKQIEGDLAQIEQGDQYLNQLQQEAEQAEQNFLKSAQSLSKTRHKAALALSKAITDGMHQLGMQNGRFEVRISEAEKVSAKGIDKVEFFVSANQGQPPQPLAKVASGGELSRISLSIQVATAEVTQLPTLIFDEVDVGIGGGIAEIVGEKLQTLGRNDKQILSITHLAQVAAHGDQHLFIEKQSRDGKTFTQVRELDSQQRIQELARMAGGMEITEQTLALAEEMLKVAQAKKA